MQIQIELQDTGKRLDNIIKDKMADISRSYIQKLIKDGDVLVNDKTSKASYTLRAGDIISVNVPPPVQLEIKPEKIPLDILYEDDDCIVINKPPGMTTHPGAGRNEGTLVNAILAHCKDLSGIGGVERPGIVHRLDKDTSGAIIVAKNDLAHNSIASQIQKKTARRCYLAIVSGEMPSKEGQINLPVGRHPVDRKKMAVVENGREALTLWKVLQKRGNFSLIQLELKTGRTHQIRVHCSYIKHPVYGDAVYGGNKNITAPFPRQALHAYKFSFTHPRSAKELTLIAPIPADMRELLNKLEFDYEELSSYIGKQL